MPDITRRGVLSLLAGGAALACLATCRQTDTTAADDEGAPYRIGVLQLVEHEALDASNRGFIAALDESGIAYEIDQQNAQGDQSACQTIAAKLVGDRSDLILAIATPAAIACAGATSEIPVVATAITDFASAELVASNDHPGCNVTGSSDLTPVAEQIRMLHAVLPEAKRVAVLWCSAEANSALLAELARAACADCGIEAIDYTVSSSNEIQSVVESMAGHVDVIYAPTDNTIAAGMSTVSMVADERRIPIVAGWEEALAQGALCTYSFAGSLYEELGAIAGEMAVRILEGGENPADMAIAYCPSDKLSLIYNEKKAELLGIDKEVLDGYKG